MTKGRPKNRWPMAGSTRSGRAAAKVTELMFVLGFDPGLSRCGYGAVRQEKGEPVAVVSGVITTPPSSPLAERLAELLRELRLLMSREAGTRGGRGRASVVSDQRQDGDVGWAGERPGLAAAAEAGIPVAQYSPNEVKQAVTGWGNAGKDQVQRMVQVLLDLPEKPCSAGPGRRFGVGAVPPGERAAWPVRRRRTAA